MLFINWGGLWGVRSYLFLKIGKIFFFLVFFNLFFGKRNVLGLKLYFLVNFEVVVIRKRKDIRNVRIIWEFLEVELKLSYFLLDNFIILKVIVFLISLMLKNLFCLFLYELFL